jgi:energy-converting hydrogenase Eha subunit C
MFVAGLAIVRVHNVWARDWTVLITLSGWSLLVLGLVRIFAASQYHQAAQAASSMAFMAMEGFLLAVALFITFMSYKRTAP